MENKKEDKKQVFLYELKPQFIKGETPKQRANRIIDILQALTS